MEKLGVSQSSRANLTHLITESDIFFVDLTGRVIIKASEKDYGEEAIALARTAKIVHRGIIEKDASFSGSFDKECEEVCSTGTIGFSGHNPQESKHQVPARLLWCHP